MLTTEDLKELGVIAVGDRRRILEALEKLRERPAPEPSPDATHDAGERREVAVLFADLTGFTALSQEVDAEELHLMLGRYFDCFDTIVEQFGGHIDKHVGDFVMAVFDAPLVEQDHYDGASTPEEYWRGCGDLFGAFRPLDAAMGDCLIRTRQTPTTTG